MVKIVTDSTCDLPADLARQYDIRVIPMAINIGERSYLDGVDISRAEYYRRLPDLHPLPTTSASSAEEFERVYRALGDVEIVSIHIGSGLSGVLNVAQLGAEAAGGRITLIDSQQASMGLGWQVLTAAETAAAGGDVPAIQAAVAAVRSRVRVLALLDTVEYLRRGGRANAMQAAVGELLQIKPLIEVFNNQVNVITRPRTHARGMDKLVEIIESHARLERLAVLHANNSAAAEVLASRVAPCVPGRSAPPLLTDVTAIVGTHAGPGAVGVAIVPAPR